MKQFSANLVITNYGPPQLNGLITTLDDGTILSVNDTLNKEIPVEFYEGIIIPGFVNCHCHLEISHLKGAIREGSGLAEFIGAIRNLRNTGRQEIIKEAENADNKLYNEGVVLCADICNTDVTFQLKKNSKIEYYNFLEVFGIDPAGVKKRIEELEKLEAEAGNYDLKYSVTPHSVYSVSLPLFSYLRERTGANQISSIHFLESEQEKQYLYNHTGPVRDVYEKSGIMPQDPATAADHADAILNELTPYGNLILVHNTYADNEIIGKLSRRKNIYWCLCPGSNLYISGAVPSARLLLSNGCNMVMGTDSLASNSTLSMISEIKILQDHFPDISLTEMIKWATINGAKALNAEQNYGSIEPGKKPGLLLMENSDILNFKLLPDTSIRRLI